MAKKALKEWPHTEEELLEMAVNKCREKNGMPKRRAWTHDKFIPLQELVDVLGKGNEQKAMARIEKAWLNSQESADVQSATSEPVKADVQTDKVDATYVAPQPEVDEGDPSALQTGKTPARVKRSRGRAKITSEALFEAIIRVQRELNLGDKLPTAERLKQYHEEHPDICPSLATFYNRLGRVATWREQLEKYSQERPAEGSNA